MRLYLLMRDADESGVSGTGHVAWACEFPNGMVAVSFRDDRGPRVRSVATYGSVKDAAKCHGHGGKTRFVSVRRSVSSRSSDSYEVGLALAMQDEAENAPMMSLPRWADDEQKIAGMHDFARANYGRLWRDTLDLDVLKAADKLGRL